MRCCHCFFISFSHIYTKTPSLSFFFFNDTATTEIYTLSLHDALPISDSGPTNRLSRRHSLTGAISPCWSRSTRKLPKKRDRKSTRLNSSHGYISYAVFCLKKKKRTESHLVDLHSAHRARRGTLERPAT